MYYGSEGYYDPQYEYYNPYTHMNYDADPYSYPPEEEENYHEENEIEEAEHFLHSGTYGEVESLWDSYENQFYTFIEESQSCDCCKGYPYNCACNSETCVCFSKYDWFPQAAGCTCCKGYSFNCSSPECTNGHCVKCTSSESSAPADSVPDKSANAGLVFASESGEPRQNRLTFTLKENKKYFDVFEDCSCCKGFVFNCASEVCEQLGSCGCFYDYDNIINAFEKCLGVIFQVDQKTGEEDYQDDAHKNLIRLSLRAYMIPQIVELILQRAVLFDKKFASNCARICKYLTVVIPFLRPPPSTGALRKSQGDASTTPDHLRFQQEIFSQSLKIQEQFPVKLSEKHALWKDQILNFSVFISEVSERKILRVNFLEKLFEIWLERGETSSVYTNANLLMLKHAPLFVKRFSDFEQRVKQLKAQEAKHSAVGDQSSS